jgi:hypothetical protein
VPHNVRVVRLRGRPGIPAAPIAIAMGLAWILELWLLVLGCAAAALVLIRRRHWYRRAVMPAVVAGCATAGPSGVVPSDAVEEWAAVWLAVAAEGRPRWLRNAARLLAETDGDPWAVHVAITRLEVAEARLTEGRILGLSPRRGRIPPEWRAGIWVALAIGFLGVAHWQGTWWLVPTAAALGSAACGLTELEQSRVAPRLLAMEAIGVPYRWADREPTALELALLARGNGAVLRRARRLVETARWNIPDRQTALRKLTAAEAMTSDADWKLLALLDNSLPWWKPL